jgi:hypothetical protein
MGLFYKNKMLPNEDHSPIKALQQGREFEKQLLEQKIKEPQEIIEKAQFFHDLYRSTENQLIKKIKIHPKTEISLEKVRDLLLSKSHPGVIKALLKNLEVRFSPDDSLVFMTKEANEVELDVQPRYFHSLDFTKQKIFFCLNKQSIRGDQFEQETIDRIEILGSEHLEEILMQSKKISHDILEALFLLTNYAENKRSLTTLNRFFLNHVGEVSAAINGAITRVLH